MPVPRRPRALALLLGMPALAVLAGCEKPTPGVSVYSGTKTLRSEALCWNEGDATRPENCRTDRVQRQALPVREGRTISINVDPPLERTGWIPALNRQALVREPLRTSSYRFTLPDDVLRTDPELEIYAGDRLDGPSRGLWAFPLQHKQ